jgi:hypothetical protein
MRRPFEARAFDDEQRHLFCRGEDLDRGSGVSHVYS